MDPLLLSGFTWGAVQTIIAAAALFGSSAFWVLWRLHRRLRRLEEGSDERNDAIFGSNGNPLHVGLAREVMNMQEEIDEVDAELSESAAERQEILQRLTRTEAKLDTLLDRLDD